MNLGWPSHMKFVDSVSNTERSRLTDFDAKNRLIRVMSDNFDTHIHTKNRVKQINGLATIITQSYSTPPASLLSPHDWPLIPYLAQEKTKDVSFKEVQIQFFNGPKKPPLPKSFLTIHVLSLKVLCKQVVLSYRAKKKDFELMKSSLTNDKVLDYNGFNTKRTCDSV